MEADLKTNHPIHNIVGPRINFASVNRTHPSYRNQERKPRRIKRKLTFDARYRNPLASLLIFLSPDSTDNDCQTPTIASVSQRRSPTHREI